MSSLTLEIIFATCFGRGVEVLKGEDDSLTKATTDLFKIFKRSMPYMDVLLST